jgi:hypothetical protein
MVELTPPQTLVINGVRNVTRLLAVGWLAALAVLVAKLLSHGRLIEIAGMDFPVRHAWILFAIVTLVHVAASAFLMRHIKDFCRMEPSAEARNRIFEEIKSDRNLFVHGLIPRTKLWRPGGSWYRMDPRDPSAWAAYLGQIVLFAAVLPWSLSEGNRLRWETAPLLWAELGAAFLVAGGNWYAGSAWIISLSRLAEGSDPVLLHLMNFNNEMRFPATGKLLFWLFMIVGIVIMSPILLLRLFTKKLPTS